MTIQGLEPLSTKRTHQRNPSITPQGRAQRNFPASVATQGHNPPTSPALGCLLSPGADIASVQPSESISSARCRSALIAMARYQRRSAPPVAPASSAGRRHRGCRTGCTPCAGRTLAPACDRATGRRSAPPDDGTANTTPRATARRWRACCRGSSAARPGIEVVCSCRGGYSPQQCHGKFRPVRATGHGAGPGRRTIGGWHWRGRSETGDVPVPR
jgi:hypothetical protein